MQSPPNSDFTHILTQLDKTICLSNSPNSWTYLASHIPTSPQQHHQRKWDSHSQSSSCPQLPLSHRHGTLTSTAPTAVMQISTAPSTVAATPSPSRQLSMSIALISILWPTITPTRALSICISIAVARGWVIDLVVGVTLWFQRDRSGAIGFTRVEKNDCGWSGTEDRGLRRENGEQGGDDWEINEGKAGARIG